MCGADGDSLELTVEQLRARRTWLFFIGFCGLAALFVGAIALAWIKMGPVAFGVTVAFGGFAVSTFFSIMHIYCSMGTKKLVTGSTQIYTPE